MQTASGPALRCRDLEPYARHLFTTRPWILGSALLADEVAGWDEVAAAMGVDRVRLVRVRQVHGADVLEIRRDDGGAGPQSASPLAKADVIVSDDPAAALAIQTADCVPLLLADRRTGAVAAAHAGWRGLAAGVPGVAVAALARAFGSAPADLVAGVGPSIDAPSYEVDRTVRTRFESAGVAGRDLARWFLPGRRADHWQFDGWQAVRDQLEAAGLSGTAVHVSGLCTSSSPGLFCSYRRDGAAAGRMAAAIRARQIR